MNKILGSALGIGMLLAAAAPTFAATNVTLNTTGPFSKNRVTLQRGTYTKVNNIQFGFVKNKIDEDVNTGDNKSLFNTDSSGGEGTGTADSNIEVGNDVNNTLTAIDDCGCPEGDTDVTLEKTGPFSSNKVYINDSSKIKVNNIQIGIVKNKIESDVNTGGNSSSFNTISGGGSTGNANSTIAVTNLVNTSTTIIGPVEVVPGP